MRRKDRCRALLEVGDELIQCGRFKRHKGGHDQEIESLLNREQKEVQNGGKYSANKQ